MKKINDMPRWNSDDIPIDRWLQYWSGSVNCEYSLTKDLRQGTVNC